MGREVRRPKSDRSCPVGLCYKAGRCRRIRRRLASEHSLGLRHSVNAIEIRLSGESVRTMATAHPIHKRWLLFYLLICIFTARSSFSQSPSLASHLNSKLAPKTSSQAVPQAVSPAEGQGDQPAKATPKDEVILVDPLGRSTPYGCVIGFLQAVNGNDLPKAAQYLDTKLPEDQAEELAKQLKVVLDTGLSSSINGLSRETLGKLTDDLRVTREKVGVADTQDGNLDIFLDRISRQDAEPIWLFSAETLAQIPDAYAHLSRHDVSRFLPAFFVSLQLLGLPLWRWLVILIVVTGAIFLSSFVTRILFLLFGFFLNYRHVKDKKDILVRLKMPVTVLLLALAISSFEPYTLSVLSRHYWTIISRTMGLIGFAWFFVRLFDTVGIIATRHSIENGTREKNRGHRTSPQTLQNLRSPYSFPSLAERSRHQCFRNAGRSWHRWHCTSFGCTEDTRGLVRRDLHHHAGLHPGWRLLPYRRSNRNHRRHWTIVDTSPDTRPNRGVDPQC